MVVTYYVKLFRAGADRHNGILISLPFLVPEATSLVFVCRSSAVVAFTSSQLKNLVVGLFKIYSTFLS